MPRNEFQNNNDRIEDLIDDPVEQLSDLIMMVNDGKIAINDARRMLGLPPRRNTVVNDLLADLNVEFTEGEDRPLQEIPVENLGGLFEEPEKVEETLQNLRGNEGFTTTAQHLERLREPTRWERG